MTTWDELVAFSLWMTAGALFWLYVIAMTVKWVA